MKKLIFVLVCSVSFTLMAFTSSKPEIPAENFDPCGCFQDLRDCISNNDGACFAEYRRCISDCNS